MTTHTNKEINDSAKANCRNQGLWAIASRKLVRTPTVVIGFFGITGLVVMTLLSPIISPYDPVKQNFDDILSSPSLDHIFGTDDLGRDVFSRVLWGGRESLRVAAIAMVIAIIGGLFFGLISGYYGGAIDMVIQRLVEVSAAFPTILLLLSIVAALGPSLTTVLVALGISYIPNYTRLVRGCVISTANQEYVTAAQVVGANSGRIMFRHIMPNVLAPIIVFSTIGLGGSIMLTAGLSYIGLGAQPPSPEWGAMLNYGRSYLRDGWWMSVFPGIAIFIAVLSVNLIGDGLRDALDPKLRE